jgi:hypothetical protein
MVEIEMPNDLTPGERDLIEQVRQIRCTKIVSDPCNPAS